MMLIRRCVIVLMILFCASRFVSAETKESFMLDEDAVSWESLLEKAKTKQDAKPEETVDAEDVKSREPQPERPGEDLHRQWAEALREVGYATPEQGAHGLVKTHYNNGDLQSERIFDQGVIQELRWYSVDHVMIFEGYFENGQLVRRKRYTPTGELESEWVRE